MLEPGAQQLLFRLAHAAIEARLAGADPPSLPEEPPALRVVRGVFVTLRRQGELRGCIGHVQGQRPLAEAVRALAVSSAFEDRRFAPVEVAELAELVVELSVLSPLDPADPARVEVGRHGLFVRRGQRSGLLLPQVASERGWDRETFLAHTCRKAGLPADAWRDPGAELRWFTCDVYYEGAP